MAFWRIGNGFSSVSAIDKILDKNDHSLVELLNEPDLLQELLAPNTKLIEYLRQPNVLGEMIRYVADLNDTLDNREGEGGGGPPISRNPLDDKPLPAIPQDADDEEISGSGDNASLTDNDGDLELHTIEDDHREPDTPIDTASGDAGDNNEDHFPSSNKNIDDDDNIDSTDIVDHDSPFSSSSSPLSSDKLKHSLTSLPSLLNRTGYAEGEEDEDDEGEDNDNDHSGSSIGVYDVSDDDIQEIKQRHAQVCAEILSADVWSLTEALMEYTELIDEVWKILDYPTPLDISYASYFTKINEHLLDKKTDEMLAFIRNQKKFVKRFIKHIDNPPLMDFLLKVISSDKSDNSTGIIDVSNSVFAPLLP